MEDLRSGSRKYRISELIASLELGELDPARLNVDLRHLQLSRGELAYRVAGDSDHPPVLLLHGLGSCGEDWLFQISALREDYFVIAPDQLGHGRSSDLPASIRISELADDMALLLERTTERPAHVVGLSLGGMQAQQLGISHPDKVKSLVLVNTFPRFRTSARLFLRGAIRSMYLLRGRMDLLAEWLAEGLFPKQDQSALRRLAAERLGSNSRRNYYRAGRAIAKFDVRSQLDLIVAPTLIVAGQRDQTVPLEGALQLQRGIRGAELRIIPDSGHASPIDAPEEFNRLLRCFLSQVERGEAARLW